MRADGVFSAARSQTIELVGPAGAGKSTLVQSIIAGENAGGVVLSLWGLPRRWLLRGALATALYVLRTWLERKPLAMSELHQMIRLHALGYALASARRSGARRILLDEGGVFALTWLEVFHADSRSRARRDWRRRQLRAWARWLHAVVRVDAADEVLAARIRARPKAHMVKQESDADISLFAWRFRRAYDGVLQDLTRAGRVRVLGFTTMGPVPEDAARLRAALEEVLRAG